MELQEAFPGKPLVVVRHPCPACGLDYAMHSCPTERRKRMKQDAPRQPREGVTMLLLWALVLLCTLLVLLVWIGR